MTTATVLAVAARRFSQGAFAIITAGVVTAAMLAGAGQLGAGPTIPGDKAEVDGGAMPTFPSAAAALQTPAEPASTDGASLAKPPSAPQSTTPAPTNAAPSPAVLSPTGPSPTAPSTATAEMATAIPTTLPAAQSTIVAPPAPTGSPTAAALAAPSPAAEVETDGTPGLKPAKVLFGGVKTAAPLAARAIGSYAKGCLSGAKALPVDGPQWQAMRLSRNRNWGHPQLVAMVQKLAKDGREKDGWPGLLVGDLSQPRGGPMLTGHASHQIGLDADVWLTPMPDRRLSDAERETMSATSMLADDAVTVARDKWTDGHLNIIKRAATYPEVERVLVHPAIKQVLCFAAKDDRSWLAKVRPYWGHHYHFHIRMGCPAGSTDCQPQVPTSGDEGCGSELDDWLKRVGNAAAAAQQPIPVPPAKPAKEKPPITLDALPGECRVVLETGNPSAKADIAAADAAIAAAAAKRDKAKSSVKTKTQPAAAPAAATAGVAVVKPPSAIPLPPSAPPSAAAAAVPGTTSGRP
ncbi:MAG: penicillin-insensitive murein endopeptidase [Hyphomicrobium aestuarii]|nr:penicillin-insensitive murein endopeptidase [Hyphomicrobium aestuarii]